MAKENPPVKLRLNWEQKGRFEAVTARDVRFVLDGDSVGGPSPMEALLGALCGCMAIDVVDILKKMRQRIRGLDVEASGQRRPHPPRYFHQIHFHFLVSGDISQPRIERAVRLSFEKYCSVFHSLREDLTVTHQITLTPEPGPD